MWSLGRTGTVLFAIYQPGGLGLCFTLAVHVIATDKICIYDENTYNARCQCSLRVAKGIKIECNASNHLIDVIFTSFLAGSTNGRAYATVLRPSVVCLWSVTYAL